MCIFQTQFNFILDTMKYKILFSDGIKYNATEARIKTSGPIKLHEKVQCRWCDGKFYDGVVVEVIGE